MAKAAEDVDGWVVFCPGCRIHHILDSRWKFNGDTDRPTFTPSLLYNGNPKYPNPAQPRCHSHIIDGRWHFLGDCSHDLAGQVVPMPDVDW